MAASHMTQSRMIVFKTIMDESIEAWGNDN